MSAAVVWPANKKRMKIGIIIVRFIPFLQHPNSKNNIPREENGSKTKISFLCFCVRWQWRLMLPEGDC